ncbi:flagellar hook-associated protein FlgL [Clostridium isatidis]|uniref:Flagellar hook-associated protein 3 n=1 Tax=Clostridium isatidis TaxID=182773 RepID=A0A343JC69_9CLOT|nr:flagellar hook-associated protein FlgL [Clostridium isatidis]ASW43127.1 flagellar hook-associated protein 3 [Clostridium isatidis]
MRVTNSMLSKSFLRDLNRNQNNLKKINNQLSSGKEISRPSDNPYKAARSMQLSSDIKAAIQYNENIKDTTNWLDTTDTALQQLEKSFQRIRELMVAGGNAAYGSDEKKAIKDEINEKVNEIAQILNTNFDGKYIFGGTKVNSKPVAVQADGTTGNNKLYYSSSDGTIIADPSTSNEMEMLASGLIVEISQGVTMKYNVSSTEILEFGEGANKVNVMNLLTDITNSLDSEDSSEVTGNLLSQMDSTISNLLKIMSEVGAKQNRMEAAATQNEDQILNLKDVLSKTEDIDFAEKTIEASVAQTVYMASLQVSARIIQPTLLDFLR